MINIKRIITKRILSSILLGIFVIISMSGILIFFGISSRKINLLHAYIGIIFILIVFIHIIKNFTNLREYLQYKSIVALLSSIFIFVIIFINPFQEEFVSPKKEIMNALFMQPLSIVAKFYNKDLEKLKRNFSLNGCEIQNDNESLMQIAKANNKGIKEVYFIFFNKK